MERSALIAGPRNSSSNISGIPHALGRARIGRTIIIFAGGIAVYGRVHNPAGGTLKEKLNAPEALLMHAAEPCC